MKHWIAYIVHERQRSIGDANIDAANIDAVFGKAPAAPDHQSGDNLQPEQLKVILFTITHFYILLKL
jgi:hypothetical protein